ncbi:PDZ domain-containing protein [Pseudenhygromyxa sp. WMMC2535]|uniref:MXAN_5808 family serine peptidase n=1 Tax=Pseudenhygromyxa sp. WMMC2535 TaxID=2712867 RepID=UPI001553582F|nr:MXAN_5808 family serine peptidase [Pseudenhygromyxa sp. WMMC2535]NVB37753.1 PDZ domain-containing protein [Pseudenhygromyxa sp. WMMC2535]
MRSLRPWSISLAFVLLAGAAGCKGKASASEGEPGAEGAAEGQGDAADTADTDDAEPSLDELLAGHDFPLLIWSIHTVSKDYYDASRFDPHGQLEAAVDYLGLHTPEFFATVEGGQLAVTVRDQSRRFSLDQAKDLDSAAALLEEVIAFTRDVLGLEDEPLHELEYAAINGFLSPLDPHTILLTPEENAELGIKTRGSFGGIGAEIVARNRRIEVVRVLPDSPAMAAGLLDGDVILEIDDQSTVNLGVVDAQGLLRGPVDSEVVLEVLRDTKRVKLTITRGRIAIPTVVAEMLPGRVGYVQVTTFQEDTAAKLKEALEQFQGSGELAGLVMDLRGNSGGLLAQAVGILNQFVTAGELVIVRSSFGREHQDATKELVVPMGLPVVTLVDEESASAAEIVGGSMKHLDRGVVIGRASFGKGTVQELRRATPYGRELALKMTIAEYRVAGDRRIQSVGVIPDLRLLPVELFEYEGVGRYYDAERFERQRERARTAHLPSAVHDASAKADAELARSKLQLRYLAVGPGGLADLPPLEEGEPRQMLDPEIRLAREIALGLGEHEGRRAQLEALPALVEGLAASEDQHVRAAMEPWKIDWSAVDDPADEQTPVAVALSLPNEPILAGEPFTLHVEVKNTSERHLERVHLITDCARDELDGIELLVGALAPGASESRDLQLQVLPWNPDFVDTLSVAAHVGEPGDEPDGAASERLRVSGRPRPRFAVDYWIIDDPHLAAKGPARPEPELGFEELEPFVVQGNGDGLIQPGEHVLFAFSAQNAGAASSDPRAILRNLSGRQGLLEEGLVYRGPLPAGGEFSGAFGVAISPSADPSLPLELELTVGDATLREGVDDKLPLRVLPGRPAAVELDAAQRRRRVLADGPARLYNGADASSPVVTQLAPGQVLVARAAAGDWLAVDAPEPGRRLWVPGDLVEPASEGKAASLRRDHRMIDPPELELSPIGEDGSGVVSGERVKVEGIARHHTRVRDVVVTVRASGPAQPERKVFYLANRALEGEEAKSLGFSAEVPLAAGSNRVQILVRDHDKVERRHELWIFRADD